MVVNQAARKLVELKTLANHTKIEIQFKLATIHNLKNLAEGIFNVIVEEPDRVDKTERKRVLMSDKPFSPKLVAYLVDFMRDEDFWRQPTELKSLKKSWDIIDNQIFLCKELEQVEDTPALYSYTHIGKSGYFESDVKNLLDYGFMSTGSPWLRSVYFASQIEDERRKGKSDDELQYWIARLTVPADRNERKTDPNDQAYLEDILQNLKEDIRALKSQFL
jgi:hypothetical protein